MRGMMGSTRGAMTQKFCALTFLFLAATPLRSVSGQGNIGGRLQHAADEASDLAESALEAIGILEGDEPEEDINSFKGEEAVGVLESVADSEYDEPAAAIAAAATAAADKISSNMDRFVVKPKKAKTGNKLCSWSWKDKQCEPTALCHYRYQFLDATVSESCRLRESFASREVFATADARVQPAVAVAGAVGLFAADLAAIRYTTWLQRFPLLFNVAQGFVLFVSGDTLFQVLEQGWKELVGLRFWRMMRSGVIGALNNGLVHYSYYKWIDKRFPYDKFSEKRWGPPDGARSKLAIGFTKWAIEWPTVGVYKIASMFILTAMLSGDSVENLTERMKGTFFLTWLRSLQVWPIYDMILYAYVPTAHRPLFNSFMSIAWGGYLSHVSQPHPDLDAEEVIEAATS